MWNLRGVLNFSVLSVFVVAFCSLASFLSCGGLIWDFPESGAKDSGFLCIRGGMGSERTLDAIPLLNLPTEGNFFCSRIPNV